MFELLENLCTALQGRYTTVSGMITAVQQTKNELQRIRDDKIFGEMFEEAKQDVMKLLEISQPRSRVVRPPRRLDESHTAPHAYSSAEDYFRKVMQFTCNQFC